MKPKLLKQAIFKTSLSTYVQATWNGENKSGWTPLGDRVLVIPDKAAEITQGGIEIPADIVGRMTLASEAGMLIAKGPRCTIEAEVGDRVSVERYGGQLVTGHDGEVYRLMDETSVGAVFR